MSARAVLIAWAAALLLIAGAVAAVLVAGRRHPIFHRAPIAVIGSSLMRAGVPARDTTGAGLLGNGWRHTRIGVNSVSEDDLIALLTRALDENVLIVFVEANPLLFDLATSAQAGRCDHAGEDIRTAVKAVQRRTVDTFDQIVGRNRSPDEDAAAEGNFLVGRVPVQKRGIYPLALRGPCRADAWRRVATRAATHGQSIVLMLPPRSATSERLLGAAQKRALSGAARALAADLRVPLFASGSGWRDSDFLDGEHLNRHGRARFVAALRDWWRTRR